MLKESVLMETGRNIIEAVMSPITLLLILSCILLLLIMVSLERNFISWLYSQFGVTVPSADVC